MNLAPHNTHILERGDRRVLGAIRLVDAHTELPITGKIDLSLQAVTLKRPGVPAVAMSFDRDLVRIQQNGAGLHVLHRAPFFDDYVGAFLNPKAPAVLANGQLRLTIAAGEKRGGSYLPRTGSFAVPRSLDPKQAESVFAPVDLALFRGPAAPVVDGWTVLRVRVEKKATKEALPGALIRVFRSPRAAADDPIGLGLSDWRGDVRGEALVAVHGLQRFTPGNGNVVMATSLPVAFEAAHLKSFTGAPGQLPDPDRIRDEIPAALGADPPDGLALLREEAPFELRAGREDAVTLQISETNQGD